MAKNNKNKNDIILTYGLAIGDDTTRLFNIAQKNDLYYLDVTLYCPEFKYDPQAVFDPQTLQKIQRQPHKSETIYGEAVRDMFGENLHNIGFQQHEMQQGVTFSFVSHKDAMHEKHAFDDKRMPHLLSVLPVQARIEKHISMRDANDFCADFRDERLDYLLGFIRQHDIIQPNKGRFGSKFNFQTILAGLNNMTQNACSDYVFNNKIEAVNRLRRDEVNRQDAAHKPFQPLMNFINTNGALSHKVSAHCRTFVDLHQHDSALINNTAINHYAKNKENIFTPKQTQTLANLYHQKSGQNSQPRPVYHRRHF